MSSVPKHIAIIMDGNERWAREKGRSLAEGHREGARNAWELLPTVIELGIPYITLYSFSSENWQRGNEEKQHLLELFSFYLNNKVPELNRQGICLKIIGRLDNLDVDLQAKIADSMRQTESNKNLTLTVAFSYGGRLEIVDACRKIINSGTTEVTEEIFQKNLYDPEMPPVDMMIRTGKAYRISNFLLWQSAYAELFFLQKYWPDFKKEDLVKCIDDFNHRERRFGGR